MSVFENDTPVVKTFVYKNKCYLYDTYNNQLFSVHSRLYYEICKMQTIGICKYMHLNCNDNYYKDVLTLMNKGYLRHGFIDKVQHQSTPYIEYLTERCMSHLVLEVTNSCNFKCRYCHQASNQTINKKVMNTNVAYRSIDLFYEHSKDANDLVLTFYGGEPLINFNLIKEMVMYAKDKFKTKRVSFNITTNASLIDEEIIDFLYSNGFSILISLDGDEVIQNSHRKFLIDGGDTFDIVWNNILKIRAKYPSFFNSNVSFNSVRLQDESRRKVVEFFRKNGISDSSISIRDADMDGIDYIYSPLFIDANNRDDDSINKDDFSNVLKLYNNKSKIPKVWHHNGPCIPAVNRLFVSTEGKFYPCEKVEQDDACSIGDLATGVDIDKVVRILNIGQITSNDCPNCWALRFCSICVHRCVDNGSLSYDKKVRSCKKTKEDAIRFFKYLIDNKQVK